MRLSWGVDKCVVFLGFPTSEPGKGGIDCFGTGFLLNFQHAPYLVTCRHIAEFIGDSPFLVRLNRYDGTSMNVPIDMAKWHYNRDQNIDVAASLFDVPNREKTECVYVEEADMMWSRPRLIDNIGIGDFCYTIGLFRVLPGEKRNMSVVHFGTVARMPRWDEDEPIPIIDWRDPDRTKTIQVEAFLVESQSLSGLSGAPVFVRPTMFCFHGEEPPDPEGFVAEVRRKVFLLGMWQGAWDAPAGQVLIADRGREQRVPIGMGVVIPVDQISDTLMEDEAVKTRERLKNEATMAGAASVDVADVRRPGAAPNENPK